MESLGKTGRGQMNRVRLYMTLSEDWRQSIHITEEMLIHTITEGLKDYSEDLSSLSYMDGMVFLEIISERNCETLEDIVFEIVLNGFETIHDTDIEIEIDLDVDFDLVVV